MATRYLTLNIPELPLYQTSLYTISVASWPITETSIYLGGRDGAGTPFSKTIVGTAKTPATTSVKISWSPGADMSVPMYWLRSATGLSFTYEDEADVATILDEIIAVKALLNNGTYGLSAIKTAVNSNNTAIGSVATQVTTVTSKVDVVDANVDQIELDATAIKNTVNDATHGNAAIKTKVDSVDTKATSIETKVNTVDTVVDSVKLDSAAVRAVIEHATNGNAAIKDAINLAMSGIDTVDTVVDAIKVIVEAIEVDMATTLAGVTNINDVTDPAVTNGLTVLAARLNAIKLVLDGTAFL